MKDSQIYFLDFILPVNFKNKGETGNTQTQEILNSNAESSLSLSQELINSTMSNR